MAWKTTRLSIETRSFDMSAEQVFEVFKLPIAEGAWRGYRITGPKKLIKDFKVIQEALRFFLSTQIESEWFNSGLLDFNTADVKQYSAKQTPISISEKEAADTQFIQIVRLPYACVSNLQVEALFSKKYRS